MFSMPNTTETNMMTQQTRPPSCAFVQPVSLSSLHLRHALHVNTFGCHRSKPTITITRNLKRVTIQNTAQKSSSPSSFPPSELPSSSKNALTAGGILASAALSIPIILALHDVSMSSSTDISFLEHLKTYLSHYELILGTLCFGIIHSGLASLRPILTPYLTERFYRVIFALASLPSATALITFFIAHRYDGLQLFQDFSLQSIPFMHPFVYALTMFAFFFLYPATFNLLEVAAVQKPSFRFYEKGITRICRHPQLVGQLLWGLSHTLWIGSSFSLVTALTLVSYHCFGVWNGDRRLYQVYGQDWVDYANRTSILPFAAILTGKQQFKPREFFVPAYAGVILAAVGFYAAHPTVFQAVAKLHW